MAGLLGTAKLRAGVKCGASIVLSSESNSAGEVSLSCEGTPAGDDPPLEETGIASGVCTGDIHEENERSSPGNAGASSTAGTGVSTGDGKGTALFSGDDALQAGAGDDSLASG